MGPNNPNVMHELAIPNSGFTLSVVEAKDGRYFAEIAADYNGEISIGNLLSLAEAKVATISVFRVMATEWLIALDTIYSTKKA